MNYSLIIFDCDGTLIDSEAPNNAAQAALLAELGYPQYTAEVCMQRFVGMSLQQSFAAIAQETGATFPVDLEHLWLNKLMQLRGTAAMAVPGALDIVSRITVKKCVASNGVREAVLQTLHTGGFMDYFSEEQVFTAAQVPRPKPYPDLFLYAAQQMGAAPEKSLVIEDGVPGVKAGVAAGMQVVGFTGTAHLPRPAAEAALRQAGAQQIIHSLNELAAIISL